MSRTYKTVFELGGQLDSTFNKAFKQARTDVSKTTNEMQRSVDAANKMSSTIKKAGGIIAGAFAVSSVISFGKDIAQTFADFEQGMANVRAISGANDEQFKKLTETARMLGETTSFSAKEAADGMQYLALAGFDTDAIIGAMPGMLNLAAAANMDLAKSADIVSDTMQAFRMDATDASKAADIFARTQARSNTDVLMLGEAMKYAASSANAAKMDLVQTNAVLGVLADSGIKGSMAGTTFNAMLRDLKKNSDNGRFSVGKTTISLYDQHGAMRDLGSVMAEVEKATQGMTTQQRDAAMASVFGEEAIRGANIMLSTGTKRYYELENAIRNSEGAAKEMADVQLNTVSGSLKLLDSAIESAKINLGEKMAPAIRFVADTISKYLPAAMNMMEKGFQYIGTFMQPVMSGLNQLKQLIAPMVEELAGSFTSLKDDYFNALKPLLPHMLSIFNSIGKTIKQIVPIFLRVSAAVSQAALKIYQAFIPIASYLAGKLYPVFSKVFGFIANDIVPAISRAFSSMLPVFMSVAGKIGQTMSAVFNFIKPIIDGLVDAFNFAFPVIRAVVVGAIDAVSGVFNGLMTALGGVLDFITGVFTGNWTQAWQGVKDIFGGIFDSLASLIKAPINAVIGLINQAISSINTVSVDIPDWVPEWAGGGKTLGFSIPDIPMLAKGGIATGPTLAMIGEGKEDEAILPLSKLEGILGSPSYNNSSSSNANYYEHTTNIYLSGAATQQDAERVAKASNDDFENRMRAWKKQQQRVSFA
ncbi:phage tail tape measure protein [Paenibacillus alvei]|uniref:Phage tail tape measure protein n=1 Tax=Paenibacillus alvei TaxID=44250 RepID=A0ABT4GZP5_PAEAL|nr:phage tail tape measure protein [Paenibacillus alvei]EJW19142.1 phage tail tape measure protein, TP901 family [Paenibacillus alvei DSM 29]MCY9541856.1 phage tail tape measure protein [Paenibacillus alvei]MCY9706308.1 phage tail tape measure protein [Paenibacillus alvei]MCY9732256.1 phage tail tape measure protein [Paenibacillus alvei]MCY9756040.1 phage tail tape measure protein [Paenibacillus alvei]